MSVELVTSDVALAGGDADAVVDNNLVLTSSPSIEPKKNNKRSHDSVAVGPTASGEKEGNESALPDFIYSKRQKTAEVTDADEGQGEMTKDGWITLNSFLHIAGDMEVGDFDPESVLYWNKNGLEHSLHLKKDFSLVYPELVPGFEFSTLRVFNTEDPGRGFEIETEPEEGENEGKKFGFRVTTMVLEGHDFKPSH